MLDSLAARGIALARRFLPPASPPTSHWLTGSFRSPAGHRSFRLFVPGRSQLQPAPLLVLLHGCTQLPDDLAAATGMNALADQLGFLVAYPEQSEAANRHRCWNWFDPAHQQRRRGEPALIAGITRQVMRSYNVAPDRVYVAGLSAGGAMALILGATYPDLYAAVGVHSGLAYKASDGPLSAWLAMRGGARAAGLPAPLAAAGGRALRVPPLIVFHGDADRAVNVRNAHQLVAQWAQWNRLAGAGAPDGRFHPQPAQVIDQHVPGGYAYTRSIYRAGDQTVIEQWIVHGLGHAWSGGSPDRPFADPLGPAASTELLRFFSEHPMGSRRSSARAHPPRRWPFGRSPARPARRVA